MDVRPEQEVGGICSATIIQAYPAKPIQLVSVIFAFITENPPATFSATPQREHRHSFPQLLCKFLEGKRGCAYIALYPARETPPVFPLPPWYTPSPSLVVGPPQQQRLQPQPRRCSIAPAPARANNRNCLGRKRKCTESTQQQPKPSSRNENI